MTTENLIFRFKFSSEFTDHLTPFAKLHQYDDRHTYKEAWTQWLVINDELVDMEVRRLKGLGYDGNIVDKMYKSGRYYFRNKPTNANTEAKPRRVYVSLEHDVIDAMDIHISVNYYLPCFKPSIAYDQFCMEHTTLINDEITRLLQEDLTKEDVCAKLKKTYKNRYFLFTQNHIVAHKNEDVRKDTDECGLGVGVGLEYGVGVGYRQDTDI